MAMQMWHEVVSPLFHPQIAKICLKMIKDERHHQKIENEVISNVIQTYGKQRDDYVTFIELSW